MLLHELEDSFCSNSEILLNENLYEGHVVDIGPNYLFTKQQIVAQTILQLGLAEVCTEHLLDRGMRVVVSEWVHDAFNRADRALVYLYQLHPILDLLLCSLFPLNFHSTVAVEKLKCLEQTVDLALSHVQDELGLISHKAS